MTYDDQQIVDKYIGYMLSELKTCLDYLVVVVNQPELKKGIQLLDNYADKVFYRKNIGFDAGGFKDCLCNLLGWEKVMEFDELCLVNDSFFGPFYPMQNIFYNMERKLCDFWGLTLHEKHLDEEGTSYTPEHLQSFFLVFRKRLLNSSCFQKFWEGMPYYATFDEVIEKYEKQLTAFFYKKGFDYASYADMSSNSTYNISNNFNQFMFISNELVRKRDFPFLKKQQIAYDTLKQQTQENIPLVLDYIRNNTDYDVDMIYENIIRIMNITDLQRKLCFQYILSDVATKHIDNNSKIGIAVIVTYKNSFDYVMEYLDKISDGISILILSGEEFLLNNYQENGFECIDILSINKDKIIDRLVSFDLVCVVHDEDMSSDMVPSYVGKSKFYHIWENLVKNTDYVLNIANVFEENKRLGLLTIPCANFGSFFGNIGLGWDGKYEEICKIVEKYNIQCRLDYMKPPFGLIENYYIRGNLFECIRKADEKLLDMLSWIWCYIAQGQGYFSGIVESKSYAEMNEINQQYYLDAVLMQIRQKFGKFRDFSELKELLSKAAIVDYCRKYKKVYVYGTGKMAEKYSKDIFNIEAYVVSDNQNKLETFMSKVVIWFSEMPKSAETGIIVCMDEKHQKQVVPMIEENGIKDYLCI